MCFGVLAQEDYSYCCSTTKLCHTLCDPMDYSLPGSLVHEISLARILEWVPISSRGSFPLRLWAALRLISYFGKFFFSLTVHQFSSVVSDSLRPHESQHARPPCPSPTTVHSRSLLYGSPVSISSLLFHLVRVCGISSLSWETPSGAPSLVHGRCTWHRLATHVFHWLKWLD